jgi:transposase, IS5 family
MTDDFFRARLDKMIDLTHALTVLASKFSWAPLETALASAFAGKSRDSKIVEGSDLFGTTLEIARGGVSAAARPRPSIRFMAALLYLKHTYNLSDNDVVQRWSQDVVWQYFLSVAVRMLWLSSASPPQAPHLYCPSACWSSAPRTACPR